MNPITSYAAMLRHEPHRGQHIAATAPMANDDAQVAAILSNLSTIAEKEFGPGANSRILPRQPKKHQHPLLDSKPSVTSIAGNISLESYLQSCRLKKMQQRARAVSIDYTSGTTSSGSSYMLSPQSTEVADSLSADTIVSPLSMPSALVTPASSPILGSRVVVRSKKATALPRVIHLSPKAIADSAAHTNGVRTAMLSAGFKAPNQIPPPYPTAGKYKSRQQTKSTSTTKAIAKKKQPKNIVPAKDGSKKMLIMKRFCWRDFPELENILISNRREYLSFSSRNYSPAQKKFNNNLTATIIKTAEDCGYKFSPQHFDFSAVRDRIRCFYKSYVQGEKKRLFAALAAATSAEERRALQKEIAFLDSRSSGTRKS